ncbi:hypothetical protein MFUL124B02_21215 [Myxococcus fulvus 124B02]|nr:hypothetical protein MFUL124B02_21215 [Myxococcus fulvus 124B02]
MLGFAGTAMLWWVLHYTDGFEQVGGFLALGGALSWLAFVLRLISEDRTKQLQSWLDEQVLSNPRTPRFTVAALVGFVAFIHCLGTIELEAPREAVERSVEVRLAGAAQGDEQTIPASRALRMNFWRWPFSAPEIEVRVMGYPERRLQLSRWWWRKTTLRIPESFLRPVILVRPEEHLANRIRQNKVQLNILVTREGRTKQYSVDGYGGEGVWIGCAEDVEVPAHIRTGWTAELRQASHPLMAMWSRPRVPVPAVPPLETGDIVDVHFSGHSARVEVAPVPSFSNFPQEVVVFTSP